MRGLQTKPQDNASMTDSAYGRNTGAQASNLTMVNNFFGEILV